MVAFDGWLLDIFTRPADENDWFLSPDIDPPHDGPADMAENVARLLTDPGHHLAPFDDLMVAAGLYWLVDSAEPDMLRGLGHDAVPQETRLAVIAGLPRLYEHVIVPRVPECLGRLSEDGGPLGSIAYMFWDLLLIDGPANPRERAELERAMVDAMALILALPHAAAQEAALHGLGHLGGLDEERIGHLIDGFMAKGLARRTELVPYAKAARTGCIP